MTPDEARVLALGKYPEADDFQFLPSDPCAVCGGVLGITYAHGMHAECTSELWLGSRDRGIDRARQFLSTECGVAQGGQCQSAHRAVSISASWRPGTAQALYGSSAT